MERARVRAWMREGEGESEGEDERGRGRRKATEREGHVEGE